MHFKDLTLSKNLLRALDEFNYTTPTTIQEKVFSVVMSGADVCGIAQTGTGKTLAYVLPLLNQWKFTKAGDPQILILVPTRELVTQVVEALTNMGKYLSIKVVGVYGGTNINTQKLLFDDGCHVLVSTPGRLYDLAMAGAFKVKTIKKLVVDEVDEMFNLGFRTQLRNIVDLLPPRRQNLLFSATLIDEVAVFINEYFGDPTKIEAAPAGTPVENIDQSLYEVPNFNTKVNLLKLLLSEDASMTKVLIFTASKKIADEIFAVLEPAFPETCGVIHSNKEQNHRFRSVELFKSGTYKFLVATDVIARGIDVAEVTHVINFDLPIVPENYIHRIGRTGRANKKGIAISFMTPREMKARQDIEDLMQVAISTNSLPEHLEISNILTYEEQPKLNMKEIQVKPPKPVERGASFHEKSAKNSRFNKKVTRRDQMRKKYGKPVTKRGKRK